MNFGSILEEFKNVIHDITDNEALKYIQMGKGNLNLSLNYYFNSQLKFSKKSSQEKEKPKTIFSELMDGAQNQLKLEKIFKNLKKEYNKPIKSSIPENFTENGIKSNNKTKTLDLNVGGFQNERNYAFEIKKEIDEENVPDSFVKEEFGFETTEPKAVNNRNYEKKEIETIKMQLSEKEKNIFSSEHKNATSLQTSNPIKRNYSAVEKLTETPKKNSKTRDFPKYLGVCIIKGYTLRSLNLSYMKKGDEIYLQREKKILLSDQNKKKKTKQNLNNKGFNDFIIRILSRTQEIGKLENEYSEILAPLLDENFITIESFLLQMPPIVETFSPIILEIKVYLLETAITKPITRIIDKAKLNEFDKEATILALFEKTKQNFANLFELLKLKKINDSLIKIPLKKLIHLDESLLDNKNHNFNKESLKMNMRDPYQKLPKQASLFDFATQNIEKNKQILLENNNITEPKPYKSAEDESLDIDYENLFQHDTITHEKTPFLDPPSSFKSLLHPYQKQALAWMLKQEGVIMNFDEKNKNNQNFESQIQGNHEKLVKNLEDIEIKIEPTKNEIEQLENKTEKNENKQYSNRTLRTLHPLWEQYAFSDGTHCFFNPYSGQLSLEIPISNSGCKGGILADEMGLGKTVMMISLFHTNSGKSNRQKEEKAIKFQKNNILLSNSIYKYANTLIIVPLTLLSQWEEELKLHSAPDHFKICLYYADFRPIDLYKYDIVITTYGTISSEYANQKQDLFQYEWFRVVLDEAHYIKGRTIQIAKAVYNLKAINRWCMTGTPIQNKLDDLFSLIHFLRLEPWSDYIWWSSYINKPYEKKDPMVFEIIRTIIAPILLRRTKKARNKNGKSIIDLPEKETSIEWVDFSKEENNLYREVYQKSKMEFDDLLSKGVFLSNYMHVFDILTRLRQICDHPYLMLTRSDFTNKEKLEETIKKFVQKRLHKQTQSTPNPIPTQNSSHFEILYDNQNQEIILNLDKKSEHNFNENYFNEIMHEIRNDQIKNCVVCLGDIEDAVITLCMHVTCRLCLIQALESSGMCPLCRKLLNKEDFMTVPRDNKFDIDLDSKFKRSSKMEKMMGCVQKLMALNEKAVIFSQFLGMLDLVEYDFKKNNINYVRLDGGLSQKKRVEVLKKFKESSDISIILISLKAGGVGLNLVEANHVYLLDPWWNPAVEEQAIERVHRIGQKRKVEVVRFICRGSIEERMMEMHKSKKELFNSAINAEGSSDNRKLDKKMQNVEYFKYLMKHF